MLSLVLRLHLYRSTSYTDSVRASNNVAHITILRTLNIACNTYGSSITHRSAGVAGSDLGTYVVNHCGESGRNVPPRPAPTAHFYFPAWRNRRRRRRTPLARRPRPAAPSRRYTTRSPANYLWLCPDYSAKVFPALDSVEVCRGESRNRVADKRCATRAELARGLALSRRKRVASVEVAQAPVSRRALLCAPTPWISPGRTLSHLQLSLGKNCRRCLLCRLSI